MDFRKIAEGIYNTVVVKEAVEKIAAERLAICRTCDYDSKKRKKWGPERCLHCGCGLKWKTHSLSSACPLAEPKWTAIEGISHDESNHIDTISGNAE